MGTGRRRGARRGATGLSALLSAVGLVVAACTTFVTAAPAAAAPLDACTATKGAVVAVDFGPFGGTVRRGCDTTPTTGYELLHEAGFTTTGTQHDGPAFICRIGYGSEVQQPTEDKESCVLTPQATAYWSYWIASPGQDTWRYSPYGAMARTLRDGDVDAWVFGGTDIGGTTGGPAFTPDDVRTGGGTTPGPGTTPTVPAGRIDVPAAATWVRSGLTDGERVVDEGAGTASLPLTTEAAYALAAADGASATLDKVTSFLAARTDAYAYPAGADQAPDATAAARLALLADITEADPRDFGGHDLVGDLAAHVCASGPGSGGGPTPGCTAEGDFRNATYADGQALAVLALLRAGVKPPAATVDRLTQVQCDDGGVTSILIRPGEYCDGDPATTGLVTLALHRAGGQDAAVAKARTYLGKAQREDGSFPGWTGSTTGSVTATAHAAQALRALGDTERADAAVSWLAGEQLAGGGFGFEEGATDPALYPTAPAVLAGTGTDLARLTTAAPEPTDPPTTEPPVTVPPTTGPPTTGPTAPADGGPDLARGVAYLTAPAQLARGRYYPAVPGSDRADFGLTVDGAYALAATGLDDNALRGIVDFLDDGGKDGEGRTVRDWTGIDTPYVLGGQLGKAALLAQAVGRDPRNFGGGDLIAALDAAVCAAPAKSPDRRCAAEGAYTYTESVFGQSLGVMAQSRAGEEAAVRKPLAYLESLQLDSGAWPSLIPSTGDADVDSTAIAAMALDLAGGEEARAAVAEALDWIAGRQLPDGGFPGAAGNSVNSAALAVQGLSLDAPKYADRIAKARAFLASQQNADGGFNVAKEGQRGSDVRASTQAVGGSTGISFGALNRDLTGTTPPPTPGATPSAPVIVTPGGTEGGTGGIVDTGIVDTGAGGGGALASTGVQAGLLAACGVALVAAGRAAVVLARRRTAAGGRP